MTTNTIEPEAEDTEPKFRTRAEAEAEIALRSMKRSSACRNLVKDDIERLEEQRDKIEGKKKFANLVAVDLLNLIETPGRRAGNARRFPGKEQDHDQSRDRE